MRDVPSTLTGIWRSGDYTGTQRAMARATVQQANVDLYRSGLNTFASLVFGATARPRELPNIKSVSWDRDVDSDVASCTIEMWNVRPLDIGEQPTREDIIAASGWYSPFRGESPASSRWGQVPNEWARLLLPDNIVRTYEGYGFDASVCPDKDPNLVSTGVWMIDEVVPTSDAVVTLTLRDIGRILIDQILMQPIVPDAFYPLSFSSVPKKSGVRPPQLLDSSGSVGSGPTAAPTNVAVAPGNGTADVSWDAMPAVDPAEPLPAEYQGGTAYRTDTGKFYLRDSGAVWHRCTGPGQVAGVEYLYGPWVDITEAQVGTLGDSVASYFGGAGGLELYTPRYECVGFHVYVDGVLQGFSLDETQTSVTVPRVLNGSVYYVEVAAVYQELNTGSRYTADKSAPIFFSPRSTDVVAVDMFSLTTDTDRNGNVADGVIAWAYVGDGSQVTWELVLFADDNTAHKEFTLIETVANGGGNADIDTGESTLQSWNAVVFPLVGAATGPGGWIGRTVGGDNEYYGQPGSAVEPPEPPAAEGRAAYTGGSTTVPANPVEVPVTVSNSSNTPYVGQFGSVYGHTPNDAFDDDVNSYWLSIGNMRPDAGYAYEWIEGKVAKATLTQVGFRSPYRGMFCYVSVYANGGWMAPDPGQVIPYDPNNPASAPNGSNVPYVLSTPVNNPNGVSDLVKITLPQAYPNVERIRLTFYNLQDSGLGTYQYRAAVSEVYAWAESATSSRTAPTPAPSTVVDSNGNLIKNAEIVTGAGDHPGEYEDYTDIVKLICAWSGFFWPQGAELVSCDGSTTAFDFGNAPYNLGPNIDPVLGGFDTARGGRVWGDFETAGTAGVADLTADIFDKKPGLDGITYVKDILGFLFYIDEDGGVVFRSPNIFSLGNWKLNYSGGAGRTREIPVIDEAQVLMGLEVTLTSKNVRERIFVSTPDGTKAGVSKGWNPNPIGLRRIGGWTDQNFETEEECQLMADLITLRQLFTYRTDNVTIPGYPGIQINDQVRIYERVTSETFVHYVKSIHSDNNLETGEWTYGLGTHWLGERPFESWAWDPAALSWVTQRYLEEVRGVNLAGSPPEPPKAVPATYTFPEYTP